MNTRKKNISTNLASSVPALRPKSTSVVASGKRINNWVATVIVCCDSTPTLKQRARDLKRAMTIVSGNTKGPGVVVFPGGWFDAGRKRASTLYKHSERLVRKSIEETGRSFIVCLGIDGRMNGYGVDQMGIALDKKGIRALARKFFPTETESGHIDLAQDYLAEEDGIKRIFSCQGRNYFICVCYDSFGMKQIEDHQRAPQIDVLLNVVHQFRNKGEGLSGDVLFARHGLAGASKAWHCPMFSAAVFYRPQIPNAWPSGVYWNPRSTKSTRHWHSEDNLLKPVSFLDCGNMQVRIFTLKKRV